MSIATQPGAEPGTPGQTPGPETTQERAKAVAEQAAGQAGSVASSAAADAKSIAEDAKGEVLAVAGEAKDKARDLAVDARQQLRQQAEDQAGRAAEAMRALSEQLNTMAGAADGGLAPDLARQASSTIDQFARKLDQGGLDELVNDVKRFARNKPGTFLLGAAAAGLLAGRLTRSVDTKALVEAAKPSDSGSSESDSSGSSGSSGAFGGDVQGAGNVSLAQSESIPLVPLADPIATQPLPAEPPPVAERPLRAPGH